MALRSMVTTDGLPPGVSHEQQKKVREAVEAGSNRRLTYVNDTWGQLLQQLSVVEYACPDSGQARYGVVFEDDRSFEVDETEDLQEAETAYEESVRFLTETTREDDEGNTLPPWTVCDLQPADEPAPAGR